MIKRQSDRASTGAMRPWRLFRYGKYLGTFLASRLERRGDTVYAMRGARILGCVAAAHGTTWRASSWGNITGSKCLE